MYVLATVPSLCVLKKNMCGVRRRVHIHSAPPTTVAATRVYQGLPGSFKNEVGLKKSEYFSPRRCTVKHHQQQQHHPDCHNIPKVPLQIGIPS
jgi:hypothetical protein